LFNYPLDNPRRIAALERVALLDTPAEEEFDRLTRLATKLLHVPVAVVSLVGAEREFLKSSVGLPEPWATLREVPLSHSFCKYVVALREPLIVTDTVHHPLVGSSPAIHELGVVTFAGIPLFTSDGHVLGSFCVIGTEPRVWTEDEIDILKELTASAITEIELRSAVQALQKNQDELERRVAERTAALTQSSQRLRLLSAQLVNLQELERRHLARELHDEVGQVLTGLKMMLETSDGHARDSVQPVLATAVEILGDLIVRVRDLSLTLRPLILDDQGLLPALQWQLRRFSQQTGVIIRFEHAGLERRFSPDVEIAAYRVVQEALTNVARHAGESKVWIEIWADDAHLGIQVRDQGKGFDAPAAFTEHRGCGLIGMRERVSLLGGSFSLKSRPGHGTSIIVEFPLQWSRSQDIYDTDNDCPC
jgi:signal transduction histidine kinase